MNKITLTMDLHTHPLEKKFNIKTLWNQTKKQGIDVLGITEHSEYNPKKAYELIEKTKPNNIILIPGAELNTSIGHVLIYSKDKSLYDIEELFAIGVPITQVVSIAKKENFVVSIAHPWGFNYDSAAYIYGLKNLRKLIKQKHLGIEAYNGMVGRISRYMFDSKLINKPIGLMNFIERNKVTKKLGMPKITTKLKNKINLKTREIHLRNAKAVELGEYADFITAGSDAHSAEQVGKGILRLEVSKTDFENMHPLDLIKNKKNVIWSGPFIRPAENGIYHREKEKISKIEMAQGIKYATNRVLDNVKTKIKNKLPKKE